MDLQELSRRFGKSPEELQALSQSEEAKRLLVLLLQSPEATSAQDSTQAAIQAMKQLMAQKEGAALLKRLSEKMGK